MTFLSSGDIGRGAGWVVAMVCVSCVGVFGCEKGVTPQCPHRSVGRNIRVSSDPQLTKSRRCLTCSGRQQTAPLDLISTNPDLFFLDARNRPHGAIKCRPRPLWATPGIRVSPDSTSPGQPCQGQTPSQTQCVRKWLVSPRFQNPLQHAEASKRLCRRS